MSLSGRHSNAPRLAGSLAVVIALAAPALVAAQDPPPPAPAPCSG
jgi:hypothetical protein